MDGRCMLALRHVMYVQSLTRRQNANEDLHNLMLGANNDAWPTLAETSFIGRLALAGSSTNWDSVLGGSNDDAQWIILALWKARLVGSLRLHKVLTSLLRWRTTSMPADRTVHHTTYVAAARSQPTAFSIFFI